MIKRYNGRAVVDHVALRMAEGEISGFLGPNGSGKTTTIRMMCGLLTPDAGEGTVLGFDVIRQGRRIKPRSRLHDAAVLVLRGSVDRGKSRFRRPALRSVSGAATMSATRSRISASHRAASSWPAHCRAAGNSASRLPPASCTSRNCCCSTSRLPASIPRRGASSGTRSTSVAAGGLTVLVSTHYMDEAERCHRIQLHFPRQGAGERHGR